MSYFKLYRNGEEETDLLSGNSETSRSKRDPSEDIVSEIRYHTKGLFVKGFRVNEYCCQTNKGYSVQVVPSPRRPKVQKN